MRPTRLFEMFCALSLAVSCSGCATIISGSAQKLTFQTNPPGATVSVDGNVVGTTPVIASVKRNDMQAVTFSKEGFETLNLQLRSGMNGWFWGNILFGGLFGSTTDNATGSIHEYSPSEYLLTLQPKGTSSVEASSAMSKSQKIKEFIVVNNTDLRSDLKRGNGNFLSSLLQLLDVRAADQPSAIKKISILADNYSNVSQFADSVVNTYVKE